MNTKEIAEKRYAVPGTTYPGYAACDRCNRLSDDGGLPQCKRCEGNYCRECMATCSEADEGHWGRGECKECEKEKA